MDNPASRRSTSTSSSTSSTTVTHTNQDGTVATTQQCCPSLVSRCQLLIVAHFERYPMEAFGILSESDWESIVTLKYRKTVPQNGRGGLDGTGRVASAIRADLLHQIETLNPHLSESQIADQLVWKDCVNQKFKSGGYTRPVALNDPWPVLVEKIQSTGTVLMEYLHATRSNNNIHGDNDDDAEITSTSKPLISLEQTIQMLVDSPMNVTLLQATGIGKTLRQFLKGCSKQKASCVSKQKTYCVSKQIQTERRIQDRDVSAQTQLEQLLQKWKNLAKASGITINHNNQKLDAECESSSNTQQQQEEEDLRLAEECKSWRELYNVLQQREARTRASQGERMREIRQNLNKNRPKIVKVRPTSKKQNRILEKHHKRPPPSSSQGGTNFSSGGKMNQLRKECATMASLCKLKRHSVPSPAFATPRQPGSFGNAVAFASSSSGKPTTHKTKKSVIDMSGGKLMKLPKNVSAARNSLLAVRSKPSNGVVRNSIFAARNRPSDKRNR